MNATMRVGDLRPAGKGLYVRVAVDSVNVTRLWHAVQSGATLPPLIIARQGNTIVDGRHRYEMFRKHYGDDHEVAVEVRDYAHKRDVLADMLRCNAAHGKQLSAFDRAHVAILAKKHGLRVEALAECLRMPADELRALIADRNRPMEGGITTAIKQNLAAIFRDRVPTAEDVEAQKHVSALGLSAKASEMCLWLERDWWRPEDLGTYEALERLHAKLGEWLATHKKPEPPAEKKGA